MSDVPCWREYFRAVNKDVMVSLFTDPYGPVTLPAILETERDSDISL